MYMCVLYSVYLIFQIVEKWRIKRTNLINWTPIIYHQFWFVLRISILDISFTIKNNDNRKQD